jgi:hypothetical protein
MWLSFLLLAPTGEAHIARYFWQRRVDDLFKVDFFVVDVEERLARAEARFAIAQRPRRLVAVQWLDIEHLERL